MSWKDKDWVTTASVLLKFALAISVLYVGGVFLQRSWRQPMEREEVKETKFHDDLYVHPPKANVVSLETARDTLTGKTLWVKEGYRWAYQPGDQTFGPLEEVTPTGAYDDNGQTRIRFEKGGRTYSFAISGGGRYLVDDIFFIKDPRDLYTHWSAEDWEKIEAHEVAPGMSELQVVFALGFGEPVQLSSGGKFKVMEYSSGAEDGIDPVLVTFSDGVATNVEPAPAT